MKIESGGKIPIKTGFSLREKEERKTRVREETGDVLRCQRVCCWNESRCCKLTFTESWQDGVLSSTHGPGTLSILMNHYHWMHLNCTLLSQTRETITYLYVIHNSGHSPTSIWVHTTFAFSIYRSKPLHAPHKQEIMNKMFIKGLNCHEMCDSNGF